MPLCRQHKGTLQEVLAQSGQGKMYFLEICIKMSSFLKMISLKRMSFSYVINKHQIWEEKFWVSILVLLLALFGHFPHLYYKGWTR